MRYALHPGTSSSTNRISIWQARIRSHYMGTKWKCKFLSPPKYPPKTNPPNPITSSSISDGESITQQNTGPIYGVSGYYHPRYGAFSFKTPRYSLTGKAHITLIRTNSTKKSPSITWNSQAEAKECQTGLTPLTSRKRTSQLSNITTMKLSTTIEENWWSIRMIFKIYQFLIIIWNETNQKRLQIKNAFSEERNHSVRYPSRSRTWPETSPRHR